RQLRFDGEDIVPASGDQLVDEQLEERGVVRIVVQSPKTGDKIVSRGHRITRKPFVHEPANAIRLRAARSVEVGEGGLAMFRRAHVGARNVVKDKHRFTRPTQQGAIASRKALAWA